MEDTVHLKDVMQLLKKKLLFILSITILAGVISGVVSFYVLKPAYQASTQLLVSHPAKPKQALDMNQLQTDLTLVKSYQVMMRSPVIMEKVRNGLALKQSKEALTKKINISSETDSQIIDITVTDQDPQLAVELANTFAQVFQSEVEQIMNVKNISIFTEASVADTVNQSGSSPLMNVIIALVAGFAAGIGLVFFLEYLDHSVKRKKDIESLLDLPVLAVIPDINDNKRLFKEMKHEMMQSESAGAKGGKVVES